MSITLTYRGETSLPVEIEGLIPDWACNKPLAQIESVWARDFLPMSPAPRCTGRALVLRRHAQFVQAHQGEQLFERQR